MFHVEQNSIKTYTTVTLESYTCNTFPAAFRNRQRLRIISDSIPADTCRLDSGHNRRPDNSQQKLILVPTVTTELPLFVVSSIIENPTLVSPSAAVENIVAVSNRSPRRPDRSGRTCLSNQQIPPLRPPHSGRNDSATQQTARAPSKRRCVRVCRMQGKTYSPERQNGLDARHTKTRQAQHTGRM